MSYPENILETLVADKSWEQLSELMLNLDFLAVRLNEKGAGALGRDFSFVERHLPPQTATYPVIQLLGEILRVDRSELEYNAREFMQKSRDCDHFLLESVCYHLYGLEHQYNDPRNGNEYLQHVIWERDKIVDSDLEPRVCELSTLDGLKQIVKRWATRKKRVKGGGHYRDSFSRIIKHRLLACFDISVDALHQLRALTRDGSIIRYNHVRDTVSIQHGDELLEEYIDCESVLRIAKPYGKTAISLDEGLIAVSQDFGDQERLGRVGVYGPEVVRLYDFNTGSKLSQLVLDHRVLDLCYLDGQLLILAEAEPFPAKNLKVVDLEGNTLWMRQHDSVGEKRSGCTSGTFSPDGKRILLCREDWVIQVIDAVTGVPVLGPQIIPRPEPPSSGVSYLHERFSPDGTLLAVCGIDPGGAAFVVDATTGEEVVSVCYGDEFDRFDSAIISSNNKFLATTRGRLLQIWDIPSGEEVFRRISDNSGRDSISRRTEVVFGRDNAFLLALETEYTNRGYQETINVWSLSPLT